MDVWIPTENHEEEFCVFISERTWLWIQQTAALYHVEGQHETPRVFDTYVGATSFVDVRDVFVATSVTVISIER